MVYHKEMTNVWGDRYAYPDLNLNTIYTCMETSHSTPLYT